MKNTSWKHLIRSAMRCAVVVMGFVGLYAGLYVGLFQSHVSSKSRNKTYNPERDSRNESQFQLCKSAYKAWQDDNDLVRAESLFRQAIAMDATDNLSWHRLAQVLDMQGKRREALNAYHQTLYPPRNVVSSTQDDISALYRYAQLCDQFGQHDEAMRFYSRILSVSRLNGWTKYGDFVIAVDTQDSREIHALAILLAGMNYATHNTDEGAISYYQEAIRLKPDLAAAHYVLARTCESYIGTKRGGYYGPMFKTEYALAKRLGGEEVQQAIQRKIDRATQMLEKHGIHDRYVDADGDIRGRTWGGQSVRPLESVQAAKARHAALRAHYLRLQKVEKEAIAARLAHDATASAQTPSAPH